MAHKVNEIRKRDCHADIAEWGRDYGDREERSRENHVTEEDQVRNSGVGFESATLSQRRTNRIRSDPPRKVQLHQEKTWVEEGDDTTTDQVEE